MKKNNKIKIGKWVVDPSSLTLSQGEYSVCLRLKAITLLLKLAESSGQVVMREQLIMDVWPDTAATDDTLNSTIAELRKVLIKDDMVDSYISTVPKKGYRLNAPVEHIAHNDIKVNLNRVQLTRGIALSGVLIFLSIGLWLFNSKEQVNPVFNHSFRAELVASTSNVELFPRLSADANKLAYIQADPDTAKSTLVIKDLINEQRIEINAKPELIGDIAWSPNDDSIAFLQYNGLKCEGKIVSSLGGPIISNFPCSASAAGTLRPSLDWMPNGHELVIPIKTNENGETSLYIYDITTQKTKKISDANGHIDANQKVSPLGDRIAFTRTSDQGGDKIGVVDLQTQQLVFLHENFGLVRGIEWLDQNSLIVASDLSGRSELWQIDLATEKVAWLGVGGKGVIHIDYNTTQNALVYSELNIDHDILIRQKNTMGEYELIDKIESGKNEVVASISSSEALISFVRDSGVSNEVWLHNIDKKHSKKLLSLKNATVNNIQWSPNDTKILIQSFEDINQILYVYSFSQGHFFPIMMPTGAQLLYAIWGESDDSMLVSLQFSTSTQVWAYDLSQNQWSKRTNSGGHELQLLDEQQKIVMTTLGQRGLSAISVDSPNNDTSQQAITHFREEFFKHWNVSGQYIYYLPMQDAMSNSIYSQPLSEREDKTVAFKSEHFISWFDISHNLLITSEVEQRNSDIYMYANWLEKP